MRTDGRWGQTSEQASNSKQQQANKKSPSAKEPRWETYIWTNEKRTCEQKCSPCGVPMEKASNWAWGRGRQGVQCPNPAGTICPASHTLAHTCANRFLQPTLLWAAKGYLYSHDNAVATDLIVVQRVMVFYTVKLDGRNKRWQNVPCA